MKRLRIWDSAHRDVQYFYEDENGRPRPIPFDPKDTERHLRLKDQVLAKARKGTYWPE
jgi:hypothetical protein